MVLGFNHNIRYKGELFHVQTEDSGRANPHIVTLLYRGGTILASAKTSYADIIKVDQLELVVESIMKDQHKEMMKRLKAGEFDARIFGGQAPAVQAASPQGAAAPPPPAERTPGAAAPGSASPAAAHASAAPPATPAAQAAAPEQAAAPKASVPPAASAASTAVRPSPEPPASPTKRSLDEVILDYLITGEEK